MQAVHQLFWVDAVFQGIVQAPRHSGRLRLHRASKVRGQSSWSGQTYGGAGSVVFPVRFWPTGEMPLRVSASPVWCAFGIPAKEGPLDVKPTELLLAPRLMLPYRYMA